MVTRSLLSTPLISLLHSLLPTPLISLLPSLLPTPLLFLLSSSPVNSSHLPPLLFSCQLFSSLSSPILLPTTSPFPPLSSQLLSFPSSPLSFQLLSSFSSPLLLPTTLISLIPSSPLNYIFLLPALLSTTIIFLLPSLLSTTLN